MSSVNVPLSWELQIKGAEDVKSRLQQLNQEFKNNEISVGEYSKGLRQVNNDARILSQTNTIQKNMFLAMHPAVNNLSRAMSGLSSVARTALSITNALNLATLAFNSTSVSLAEIQAELAQKQRELAIAVKKFGDDSIEVANLQGEINVLLVKQQEEAKRLADQQLSNAVTLGAAIALIGKSAFGIATKIGPHMGAISLALKGLGAAAGSALIAFGPLAAAITVIAAAVGVWIAVLEKMSGKGGPFSDFLEQFAEILGPNFTRPIISFFTIGLPNAIREAQQWFGEFITNMSIFFTDTIPTALTVAGDAISNFFLNDLPAWATSGLEFLRNLFVTTWNAVVATTNTAINGIISGIESLVNSFINVINRMISAYNRIASKIGLGKISTIGSISLPRINIPVIAAATGFEGIVNGPTHFLAGEAGAEAVSITPLGKTGNSAGGGVTVIVQGLISEHQLVGLFDDYLKGRLKSHGFGT